MNLIDRELNLPSLPAVAVSILKAVRNDKLALTTLGEIIATDPALSAKMLKIANSGIFLHSGIINSIPRAMVVLGTDMIKNIALSFVILTDYRNRDQAGFDMERFWKRSVSAAVSAKILSRHLGHRDNDIFVTALLKNIGQLVLAQVKGEEYARLTQFAAISDENLTTLETDTFGFNHCQVGYALLTHWHLPDSICQPMLYQYHPEQAPQSCQTTAKLLQLAEMMAALFLDSEAVASVTRLQDELQELLGMNEDEVYGLLDSAAHDSIDILERFDLGAADLVPYSTLLQQANAELARINLSKEQMILELNVARRKSERMARQLQKSNEQLRELVYRDGLTGLFNHRYFHEALTRELQRARRYQSSLSLILFDIDFFKKVNDTFGHPAGDLVLTNIAKAVSSAVRPSDIVARYGGEEFAVILPHTGAAGAKVFAARLRRCVEGIATEVDNQSIYVAISAGAATTTPETAAVTKEQLIGAADQGLYISKQQGRNQVTLIQPLNVAS